MAGRKGAAYATRASTSLARGDGRLGRATTNAALRYQYAARDVSLRSQTLATATEPS